jgi:hypothetical protein
MSGVMLDSWALRLSASLVLSACALLAHAADSYVLPVITIGAEYNDNYRLDTTDAAERDGWGALADLAVTIGTESETTSLWLTPRLLTGAYDDDTIDEEREGDYYLNGGYRYKGERFRTNFRPSWSRESVLRSEIPDVDSDVIDPDVTDDSGRVQTDVERDRWKLPLKTEYSISPVQKLLAGVSYKDISYDDDTNVAVRDFTETAVSLGYGHGITERDWLSANVAYIRYEPENDLNSDTYELVGRWQRNFSELWWTFLEAGVAQSNIDVRVNNQVTEEDETNPLFRAGVVRVQERSQLRLELGSLVLGTSSGQLRDRWEAVAVYDADISPRWTFLGTLLAFDEDRAASTDDPTQDSDRKYVRARTGLGYSLRPDLMLSAEYIYTYEDEDLEGDARSNGFLIQATYQPGRPRAGPGSGLGSGRRWRAQ